MTTIVARSSESQNKEISYLYVERRIPLVLHEQAHKLLDDLLKANSIDPEEF